MWVGNRFRAVLLIWTLAVGVARSEPLNSPSVTDVDIERAKQVQPTITENDIEQARQKHPMPSDIELSRVPIPSIKNIEALPQPKTNYPLDIESLAKGYQDNSNAMAQAQGLYSEPGLFIFVSFSMPDAALTRLVDQAARSGAILVIRGFKNGSLRATVSSVQRLIGNRRVGFQIDPQAFDRYGVTKSPTFVLVRAGNQAQPCGEKLCMPVDSFVSMSGDVSLDYALEYVDRFSPRFSNEARLYLKKLKG